MQEEMSITEFQRRFQTEDDCLDALEKLRWPNGFICPNCGHDDGYRLAKRRLIQCSVCRYQSSVTASTIFHKTRIPLVHWFWMIYLVAQDKGGASAMRLAKQLNMHYKTTWFILHKIREAMSNREEARTLAGLIEMDQGFFGGTGRGVGRGKKHKTQVLVLVENEGEAAGNVIMRVIDHSHNMERDELREIVEQRVDEGSQHFNADALQAHYVVKSMGHKLAVKKSVDEEGFEHLGWAHIFISLAKRFLLGTYHGVSKKHLQPYLDEFCFRTNRRFREGSLTWSLLRACVFSVPVTYAELTT